jgi:hypothetical protein
MKALPAFLILFFAMPMAFAASDCEHTCCDKHNGWWDDDFDDCKQANAGFDTCLSDCEAAVWAARPQGPDTTGGTHYECKAGFILLALGVSAALIAGKA